MIASCHKPFNFAQCKRLISKLLIKTKGTKQNKQIIYRFYLLVISSLHPLEPEIIEHKMLNPCAFL